jgi:hypothetical protein
MGISGSRRRVGILAGLAAAVSLVAAAALPSPAFAEDSGFWYGADSSGPGPANGSAPFTMPSCGAGHAYGGYIGKIGGADLVSGGNPTGYGPGNTAAWNATDAADANANHFTFTRGVGAGGYWFMHGPNDALAAGLSAYNWGKRQANWAMTDWQRWYANGIHRMPLRILWADIESPGAHGWSSTNTAANRDVFNGFYDTVVAANEGLEPGVYSTNVQWSEIMSGHGSLLNTWEWTAQTSRSNDPSPCPTSFGSSSISAVFFGGQTASSPKAAIWQWSLGNLDYDQIDSNKSLPD